MDAIPLLYSRTPVKIKTFDDLSHYMINNRNYSEKLACEEAESNQDYFSMIN